MLEKIVFLTESFSNPYASEEVELNVLVYNQVMERAVTIANLVLGIAVVVACLIAFIVTATDIAFLSSPLVHEKLEQIVDRRRRDGSRSNNFSIISKQAIDSFDESTQTGKNALLLYLKHRLLYYVILAIVIYFLLVGWGSVVRIIARLVVKIITAIGFT